MTDFDPMDIQRKQIESLLRQEVRRQVMICRLSRQAFALAPSFINTEPDNDRDGFFQLEDIGLGQGEAVGALVSMAIEAADVRIKALVRTLKDAYGVPFERIQEVIGEWRKEMTGGADDLAKAI